MNALGKGDLKEAGVWLKPGVVNIERYLAYARPKPITTADLSRLTREGERLPKHNAANVEPAPDFLEWMGFPGRRSWKLGWWEAEANFAKASIERSSRQYGVRKPYDFINVGRKSGVKAGDWFLTFRIPSSRNVKWMYVDFVNPIPRNDPEYDTDYPCQAVQVHRPALYPRPPFRLDRKFCSALRKAIDGRIEKIADSDSVVPPKWLLNAIAESI